VTSNSALSIKQKQLQRFVPAASEEALMACGTKAEDKPVRRGDSIGIGPMLQEQSRDVMLKEVNRS
jgi:hypothetical protein